MYGHGRISARAAGALAAPIAALALLAAPAAAATREAPPAAAEHPNPGAAASSASSRPDPAALRAMVRSGARRFAPAAEGLRISSTRFGPDAVAAVAATLRSLDHGPEIASLSVYVADAAELRRECGATVVACYLPAESRMVVSGVDRAVAGVPRDFVIAHEYGHHIANSQAGSVPSPLTGGTARWATYERVCQLSRAGRLFPGDQGAHYWDDPEEAFAQSYASLNRPRDRVPWQYNSLLRPTAGSLARIHADVTRPWSGPVSSEWQGALGAAPESRPAPAARAGSLAVGGARAVAGRDWLAARTIRTPLDGPVSVSVDGAPGALAVSLRDPQSDRVLARATSDAAGSAVLAYSSCGHDSLRLEVRATGAATAFTAAITRP